MNNLKWLSNFELYLFILIFAVPCLLSSGLKPDPDFSRHHLFYPKVFHGRDNRQISSSKINQDELKHIEELVIYIDADDNKRYTLDLQLNRELITDSYFEKHQENGGYVINRPTIQDVELCHYNGKIREIPNSWAAISTCDGINGVVYDGESLHYIDSAGNGNVNGSFNGVHVLYSHNDLNKNFTCGFTDSNDVTESHHISHRRKRSTDMIHGPYNSNRKSRYIELVLVVDKMLYTNFNRDLRLIRKKCKEITNIINSLYMPLNIYVALVGVIIWTSDDEITLETSGDKTLTNFLHYRREVLVKDHPNDNAQLLTRTQFDGGVVGKALKGPICTYEYSGGVNMYHSDVIGLVATTIAHEMGHNLGMEHDTAECSCPSERCIMSPSASSATPSDWSSCSIELLALSFEHGMDYCLRNKPKRLFDSPVCGNSFVEPEEECDCGLPERCDNPCCNPITCRLHANATCATGECCDLKTCSIRKAGTECRSAIYECDLPEYCTGKSEYCPSDVFKIDGELCNSVKAYCYQGSCRTRNDQCQLLWGRSGESSADRCYELNTKGSRNGNCGYNRMKKNFTKCETEDVYCGLLQCKHYNEKLEYGMESVSTLSHSFMNSGGNVISCRTALVDLGLNEVDPGLSPDGSKCGENKMCVNQKCLPIEFVRKKLLPGACPHNCNGNGICNSKGHCHCKVGFAPPNCDTSGYGGSEDSGPASIPEEERSGLVKIIYFLLLALFPIAIVAGLHTYYTRRSPSYFWKKSRHSAYVPSTCGACCTFFNCFACCSRHGSCDGVVANGSCLDANNKNNSAIGGGSGRRFSNHFKSLFKFRLNCFGTLCSCTYLRKTTNANRHRHFRNFFHSRKKNLFEHAHNKNNKNFVVPTVSAVVDSSQSKLVPRSCKLYDTTANYNSDEHIYETVNADVRDSVPAQSSYKMTVAAKNLSSHQPLNNYRKITKADIHYEIKKTAPPIEQKIDNRQVVKEVANNNAATVIPAVVINKHNNNNNNNNNDNNNDNNSSNRNKNLNGPSSPRNTISDKGYNLKSNSRVGVASAINNVQPVANATEGVKVHSVNAVGNATVAKVQPNSVNVSITANAKAANTISNAVRTRMAIDDKNVTAMPSIVIDRSDQVQQQEAVKPNIKTIINAFEKTNLNLNQNHPIATADQKRLRFQLNKSAGHVEELDENVDK